MLKTYLDEFQKLYSILDKLNPKSLHVYEMTPSYEDTTVLRNLVGIEYEKRGYVQEAIELYERNVTDLFEGNHPYLRLAIIYRKQKNYYEEIRVIKQAIYVFDKVVSNKRSDKYPKLNYFKERLVKAIDKQNKEIKKSQTL